MTSEEVCFVCGHVWSRHGSTSGCPCGCRYTNVEAVDPVDLTCPRCWHAPHVGHDCGHVKDDRPCLCHFTEPRGWAHYSGLVEQAARLNVGQVGL